MIPGETGILTLRSFVCRLPRAAAAKHSARFNIAAGPRLLLLLLLLYTRLPVSNRKTPVNRSTRARAQTKTRCNTRERRARRNQCGPLHFQPRVAPTLFLLLPSPHRRLRDRARGLRNPRWQQMRISLDETRCREEGEGDGGAGDEATRKEKKKYATLLCHCAMQRAKCRRPLLSRVCKQIPRRDASSLPKIRRTATKSSQGVYRATRSPVTVDV